MTNPQDLRADQRHTIDTMVCLECYQGPGRLQKLVVRGEHVVCPADPEHRHHIRESVASMRLRRQQMQAREVIHNYPQLDPNPLQETAQESIDALYPQ